MKLRDLFVEFKVNNEPRDEVHYRQLKKDLQKIQNDPKQRDPETKRAVMKRKAELDAWAHSKGIKSENSILVSCRYNSFSFVILKVSGCSFSVGRALALVLGKFISTPTVSNGAATINIISKTNITSTKGVTLISDINL